MSARIVKRLGLLLPIIGAAAVLLAWTQPWANFSFGAEQASQPLTATGADAAEAIVALSLAALAATAVLTMLGALGRRILGVLLFGIGAGVVACVAVFLNEPGVSLLGLISSATAVGGEVGVREILSAGTVTETFWPLIGCAGGGIIAIGGLWVLTTAAYWPATARKYDRAARTQSRVDLTSGAARVSQWDALSIGEDPTDEPDEQSPRGQVD